MTRLQEIKDRLSKDPKMFILADIEWLIREAEISLTHEEAFNSSIKSLESQLDDAMELAKLAATAWNDPYYYDRVNSAARDLIAKVRNEI